MTDYIIYNRLLFKTQKEAIAAKKFTPIRIIGRSEYLCVKRVFEAWKEESPYLVFQEVEKGLNVW